jgi:hypothetical protein
MIMPYHAFRQRYYTYHDYYTWPEGERGELIDSKACNMSPELMRRHQQVVVELGRQIANFLQNHPCQSIWLHLMCGCRGAARQMI